MEIARSENCTFELFKNEEKKNENLNKFDLAQIDHRYSK